MSNFSPIRNFNEQRLKAQYAWFGNDAEEAPFTLGGTTVQACLSAVRSRKQLVDGGFLLIADFVARVRCSEYPDMPERDMEAEYKGRVYRVVEVADHPHSGEWRLTIGEIG